MKLLCIDLLSESKDLELYLHTIERLSAYLLNDCIEISVKKQYQRHSVNRNYTNHFVKNFTARIV